MLKRIRFDADFSKFPTQPNSQGVTLLNRHAEVEQTVLGSLRHLCQQRHLRSMRALCPHLSFSHVQVAPNYKHLFVLAFQSESPFMVPKEGLEPPRLSAPEPKSGASTNFAIWAAIVQRVALASCGVRIAIACLRAVETVTPGGLPAEHLPTTAPFLHILTNFVVCLSTPHSQGWPLRISKARLESALF